METDSEHLWLLLCSGKKISCFGLARNLIRHLISPNQDDLSYSTRIPFPGQQKLGKLPNTASLAGQRRPVQTSHWWLLNSSSSSMDTWGNLSNLWIPCKEHHLNIHLIHSTCLAQAQLYVTPKIGYVNAMLLFRSRHLALNSPLGHFNGDNAHSPPDAQNSRWLQSSFPTTATWLSLNYGEHNPSHVPRHALPFSTFS